MSDKIQLIEQEYAQTENKLLLLYLIDKMDIPLSNAQISQFALEENFMNYFALQQFLADMVQSGYLDKSQDNNATRYAVTDEGITTLEYFEKHIPIDTRNRINKYVAENRKTVKKDFEITANYFYDHANNEFIVKCGIYEEETMLMEINVSVVTREQAKLICKNWKVNVNTLYGNIIAELVQATVPAIDGDEPGDKPVPNA